MKKKSKKTPKIARTWNRVTTRLSPLVRPAIVGDAEVRRLEFFHTLCEDSGSTEGNELESLSHTSSLQLKNYVFQEEEEEDFDDVFESILTNFK